MEPFNLERAMAGDKIVYRDGTEAGWIGFSASAKPHSCVITVDKDGDILSCNAQGKNNMDESDSFYDLFMAPTANEVYACVYETDAGYPYRSLQHAEHHKGHAKSICKLTIQNGEIVAFETVKRY